MGLCEEEQTVQEVDKILVNKEKNSGRLFSRPIGAHCSIAGGLAEAVKRGALLGCSCIQLFTKNSNQWISPPLLQSDIDEFQLEMAKGPVVSAFAHSGYLINLASPEEDTLKLSLDSMRSELQRAEALELPFVVVHPGSHKGKGELAGILQVVASLEMLLEESEGCRVKIALETTAGQGNSVGHRFEHFSEIFVRLSAKYQRRVGVCLDTAHIFSAGYDIRREKGYNDVMEKFSDMVGFDRLLAVHLNDSAKGLGSRVDRHENLGKGCIGLKAFDMILNDGRFLNVPMVIETPKGGSCEADKRNLRIIRSLIKEKR